MALSSSACYKMMMGYNRRKEWLNTPRKSQREESKARAGRKGVEPVGNKRVTVKWKDESEKPY